jgi:FKBP-type peptidyl-prolyl cis-trans isomerase FkpA
MRRVIPLIAAMAAVTAPACDTPIAPDNRWAEPETIDFAASLGVDLDQMNRTASGLYWQDLEVGVGLAVEEGHQVVMHYNGWLPDGTLVDSSYQRGSPTQAFPVGAGLVIRGIDEGLIGMQSGGIRRLVIRPELAYGRAGKYPIPPLTTLVFEIEVVSIGL